MSSPKSLELSCCGLSLTKREWWVMAVLSSVCFASGVCISLQGPIYPREAEKKGATPSEYGMVFGVFELVNFIVCPIFGKYMDKLGAKCLVNCGIVLAGITSIMFGFLDKVGSHSWFIALSFALRITEAVGISASFTATFSITAAMFTNNVATMFALLECFFGFGFTLGPTIGGYFFQLGGFVCPFLVVGVLLVIDGVIIFFALPDIERCTDKTRPQAYILSVLKLRTVVLDLVSVVTIHISLGYYLATLEPHLREFHLSPVHIGFLFALEAAAYMITTPLVGVLCDTRCSPKKLMILGFIFSIASFALVGPLPFVPIDGALWMVYLGLVLHGLGMSCVMVPAFIDAIHSAVRCGLPDDLTTYSLVTGISTSAVALGAFIGPSVAGFLSEAVGFRKGTLFVIVVYAILLFAMSWFVCTEECILPKSPRNANYTQLGDEPAQEASAHPSITSPTKRKYYGSDAQQVNTAQEASAQEVSAQETSAHPSMTSPAMREDVGQENTAQKASAQEVSVRETSAHPSMTSPAMKEDVGQENTAQEANAQEFSARETSAHPSMTSPAMGNDYRQENTAQETIEQEFSARETSAHLSMMSPAKRKDYGSDDDDNGQENTAQEAITHDTIAQVGPDDEAEPENR